ncbi:uncharacterized protein LOC117590383 [Drosophila guanche]|uniref:Organic solvent tolerance-like N-terminal domain-containing protein n=1 Tax=Drosophila guanche TaxID=7266 RepID=A0A3B0JHN6_DROGU|nr:uncharacterized protein LOC117590383 [Drosophila guanche]SPP72899.1 Hypothetical predicted protein [Drosophila guanche]
MVLAGTWIILGLSVSSACLASAAPQLLDFQEDTSLYDDNLSFIQGDGQKFASSATTIMDNGHTLIHGTGDSNKISYNGHTILVEHGVIRLLEGDKPYTFRPQADSVETRKSVSINGHPATVQFSRGNIFVHLPDGTVVAKSGNNYFVGDRYAVENRDTMLHKGHL